MKSATKRTVSDYNAALIRSCGTALFSDDERTLIARLTSHPYIDEFIGDVGFIIARLVEARAMIVSQAKLYELYEEPEPEPITAKAEA